MTRIVLARRQSTGKLLLQNGVVDCECCCDYCHPAWDNMGGYGFWHHSKQPMLFDPRSGSGWFLNFMRSNVTDCRNWWSSWDLLDAFLYPSTADVDNYRYIHGDVPPYMYVGVRGRFYWANGWKFELNLRWFVFNLQANSGNWPLDINHPHLQLIQDELYASNWAPACATIHCHLWQLGDTYTIIPAGPNASSVEGWNIQIVIPPRTFIAAGLTYLSYNAGVYGNHITNIFGWFCANVPNCVRGLQPGESYPVCGP